MWNNKWAFLFLLLSVFSFSTRFSKSSLAKGNLPSPKKVSVPDLPRKSLDENLVLIPAAGSGFVFKSKSGKKYVITNWHVCNVAKHAGFLTANYGNGEQETGQIVVENSGVDLCAARVYRAKSKGLELAKDLVFDEPLYTEGYPQGVRAYSEGVAVGISLWQVSLPLADVGTCDKYMSPVQDIRGTTVACEWPRRSYVTTLYAMPGSSGSAVVNREGNLVGVVESYHYVSKYQENAGITPFNDMKKFLSKLE